MAKITGVRKAYMLVGAVFLTVGTAAHGGVVLSSKAAADLQRPASDSFLGGKPTISFYAYSVQDPYGANKVGPNDTVSASQISNGFGSAPAVTDNDKFKIPVPKKGEPGTYLYSGPPTVALLDQKKSVIVQEGDKVTLTSQSGGYTGNAFENGPTAMQTASTFGATATGPDAGSTPPPPGKAAAAAFDPYTVYGGYSYAYQPVMDATLEGQDATDSEGVLLYALDSNTFTSDDLENFPEDGAPMNDTLWTLAISASGPIVSSSQLQIDFELNPAALSEISFPGYSSSLTPAEEASLIDAQVDTALSQPNVFSIADNTATLSNFTLFPNGTTFTPLNGDDVQFAEGANAGIEETPLPAGVWEGTVLVTFLAFGKMWKKKPLPMN